MVEMNRGGHCASSQLLSIKIGGESRRKYIVDDMIWIDRLEAVAMIVWQSNINSRLIRDDCEDNERVTFNNAPSNIELLRLTVRAVPAIDERTPNKVYSLCRRKKSKYSVSNDGFEAHAVKCKQCMWTDKELEKKEGTHSGSASFQVMRNIKIAGHLTLISDAIEDSIITPNRCQITDSLSNTADSLQMIVFDIV